MERIDNAPGFDSIRVDKKSDALKDAARMVIDDMGVKFQMPENKFQELRELLNNLESAIYCLPLLGIYSEFNQIMEDKMTMYRAQVKALTDLISFLNSFCLSEEGTLLTTNRGMLRAYSEVE